MYPNDKERLYHGEIPPQNLNNSQNYLPLYTKNQFSQLLPCPQLPYSSDYYQSARVYPPSDFYAPSSPVFSESITLENFLEGRGNIGNRSCQEVIQCFSLLGDLIKSLDGNEDVKKSQKKIRNNHHNKEKEIRIGSIIFKPSRGDWMCNKLNCNNWNYAKRDKCNLCSNPNPNFNNHTDLSDFSDYNQHEWKCRTCGFVNSANKESCYKCNDRKN